MEDDEIMELLWQNGQVVTQSTSVKKQSPSSSHNYEDAVPPAGQSTATGEIQTESSHQQQQFLFMQEDEMALWLHYPLNDANFDQDFCADFLYPPSFACVAPEAVTSSTSTNTASLPLRGVTQELPKDRQLHADSEPTRSPAPPGKKPEVVQHHITRTPHPMESRPSNSEAVVRELTAVDSPVTRSLEAAAGSTTGEGPSGDHTCGTVSGAAVVERSFSGIGAGSSTKEVITGTATCEMKMTSTTGGSSASAEKSPRKPIVEDLKRKAKEEVVQCRRHSEPPPQKPIVEYGEQNAEDEEFASHSESAEPKKQVRGSTSAKRSRAAEVHNLSERRRRDRINEKMKALQELLPRCNKMDKASMLDEAIEYMKSLQLQVQMMSMGCGMVPVMFPGIPQYMPPMGIRMGMGMEMRLNRPVMTFPNVLTGAPTPTPATAPYLGPRFPMPAFHMWRVPAPDPSGVQAASQSDPRLLTSVDTQSPNQPRIPNFADTYQHYLGLHHHMQTPLAQNQAMTQPGTSKPCTNEEPEDLDNHR